jgi:hypothetical protein
MCIPRFGEKSEPIAQVGRVCGRRYQDDPSRVQQRSSLLAENLHATEEGNMETLVLIVLALFCLVMGASLAYAALGLPLQASQPGPAADPVVPHPR